MDKIAEIKTVCLQEMQNCESLSALQDLKVKYLGKTGELTGLLKSIRELPAEERPTFGAKVNELRNLLEEAFAEKTKQLKALELQRKLQQEVVDISLTSVPTWGALHPVTLVENKIIKSQPDIYGIIATDFIDREISSKIIATNF